LNAPHTNIRGVSIDVRGVTKKYRSARGTPVQALELVDLDVAPGEFVSIVGPSGCGKSTLMMLVSGLIPASSGEIRVDGKLIAGAVKQAGIVFQRDVLLDWRSVLDNVMLPVEIKKLDHKTHLAKARELLASVGLSGFEDKYPGELSGGMRQRASICRALVQNPGLLLMDEPFGALDALTREQMNVDLQRIWMRERNTVVFITHSIEEAVLLADRVVVMSARPGRIADVLQIDMPRPRGSHSRSDPSFLHHVEKIRRHFMALGILSEA
jgi:NitT/TauT family transport system ATP-binding protein